MPKAEREKLSHTKRTRPTGSWHSGKEGRGSVRGGWLTVGGGYFATDLPLTKRTISNNVRNVCEADAFFIQVK